MRPVSLEISGLNSFRQKRRIDFEPLLQDNLFGIFGPTGSGKSTILDGMTLALFGEVKRADRKTSGVVNARQEECTVSFTFELLRDGIRTRYRAERMLKKSDSGGAVTKRARLIEMGDEEIPIADKEREMTEMVERILGIRSEDFRLSVVLPQGAFAEFLHLGPKDRGAMLQRIFGLEEMGRRINDGLTELTRELKAARGKLDERLAHLSEYDDGALKAAGDAYAAARRLLSETEQRRERAESEFRAGEQLHALIVERDRLAGEEELRTEQRTELKELDERIALAERCRNLEGVVHRADEAERRYGHAAADYEKTLAAKNTVQEEMNPLRTQKEWADGQRDREGGRLSALNREIDALKSAAELEQRIVRLRKEVASRDETLIRRRKKLDDLLGEGKETQASDAKAQAELAERKAGLEELQNRREKLLRQKSDIERLEQIASQREELTENLNAAATELRQLEEAVRKNGSELSSAKASLESLRAARETLRNDLDKARVEGALSEAGNALKEGGPCPLCGSTHHPHPHEPGPDRTESIRTELEKAESAVEEALGKVGQLERRDAETAATGKGLRSRIGDSEQRIGVLAGQMESIVLETEYKGETDTTTLRRWKEKFSQLDNESRDAIEKARSGLIEAERIAEQSKERLAKTREAYAVLKRDITSGEEELGKERAELLEEEQAYNKLIEGIGLEDEAIRGKAARHMNNLVAEREQLEQKIKRIDEEYANVKERLAEATARYDLHFNALQRAELEKDGAVRERDIGLRDEDFTSLEEWKAGFMEPGALASAREHAERVESALREAAVRLKELESKIGGKTISAERVTELRQEFERLRAEHEEALSRAGAAESTLKLCERRNAEWKRAVTESAQTAREFAAAETLSGYLRGNAFINFLADERLQHICRTASLQLLDLTGGRLEIGSTSDEGFYIRDNGNGSVRRSPSTLSGGETFLVSLALSLALSDSLRVGRAPLEFFFLDEGFGTLDSELLETVMDSLERLRSTSDRAIGVISHVRELRERIPRRLIVAPAGETEGTDVLFEIA